MEHLPIEVQVHKRWVFVCSINQRTEWQKERTRFLLELAYSFIMYSIFLLEPFSSYMYFHCFFSSPVFHYKPYFIIAHC